MAVLGALLAVGLARIVAGRRIEHDPAPSSLRVLAILYTLQLGCFAVQETAEAALTGASPSSATVLYLWGPVRRRPGPFPPPPSLPSPRHAPPPPPPSPILP